MLSGSYSTSTRASRSPIGDARRTSRSSLRCKRLGRRRSWGPLISTAERQGLVGDDRVPAVDVDSMPELADAPCCRCHRHGVSTITLPYNGVVVLCRPWRRRSRSRTRCPARWWSGSPSASVFSESRCGSGCSRPCARARRQGLQELTRLTAERLQHLGVLLRARIVERRKQGNFSLYSIADPVWSLCDDVCGGLREEIERLDSLLEGIATDDRRSDRSAASAATPRPTSASCSRRGC